jgi:phosphohistidine swiveling domain-containing protein
MTALRSRAELCDFLQAWDQRAVEATEGYLIKHKLLYLRDRMLAEWVAEFGAARPLRHAWAELLNFDALQFVDFYEGVYRFRKVPRYEDILIATLLSIVAGVAANEFHDQFKRWRAKSKTNNDTYARFLESGTLLLDYLMRAYAARKAYLLGEVSEPEFEEIRRFLRSSVMLGHPADKNSGVAARFAELWNGFLKHHALTNPPHPQDLANEFDALVNVAHEHRGGALSRVKEIPPPAKTTLIKGVAASHGIAVGAIKTIDSLEDADKVLEGDIGVFRHFGPGAITSVKRVSGAIGSPECGGILGHLALVCRELGIPYVCGCDFDGFHDGQVAYLDGDKGEVRIMLSLEEIKAFLGP